MPTETEPSPARGPSNLQRARKAYRAYSMFGWLRRLWLFFTAAGPAKTVVGAGTAAVIVGTGAMIGHDALETRRAQERLVAIMEAPTSDQRAPREDLGREATLYTVRGRDQAGRTAEFDVIALSTDFHWVKGRADQMERDGRVLGGDDLRRLLSTAELGARLAAAEQLVAIGLASAEGERAAEEARATERARTLARALADASGSSKPVWLLDLGQFTAEAAATAAGDSDWQRPILIIGVRRTDAGVDIGQALAAAMNGAANLPKTAQYSRYDFTRAP